MGACEFFCTGRGKSAKEAFRDARDNALYESGHGGYTGTIAEKHEFTVISVPDGMSAREYANHLLENDDERVSDKWGPAGCVKVEEGKYLFFGWASS